MPFTRRTFLATLVGGPFAFLCGKKAFAIRSRTQAGLLFEPKYYSVSVPVAFDEINAITTQAVLPQVIDDYFKADTFLKGILQRDGRV